ncbi:hypothetical protein [Flavobacterium sp.]|uniref:hypothetical protein n=1 Tax=Flavobacterium sp. TaxID=239 RepID=UPI0031E472D3
MKRIFFTLILFTLHSCSSNYYFVNIDEDTTIYTSKEGTESIAVIPKGYGAYINTSSKKYRKIKWKNYKGWAINPIYSNANTTNNYNSSSSNYHTSTNNASSNISGGSVHVKGYTRKNGTYVSPHTRSTPRRR